MTQPPPYPLSFEVLRSATIPTRCVSEGSCFCVLRSVRENPSLTRRVMIVPGVFAPLIFRSPETRNFKKRLRGIDLSRLRSVSVNPSLTLRVGISVHHTHVLPSTLIEHNASRDGRV